MAIMSTYSSELISVSSISAYDIYKTYINPKASGKQIMFVNYISMTAFALFMGGFSTMLYYIGVGMGYLYLLMGVIISSGVIPATMTLVWPDQVRSVVLIIPVPLLTGFSPTVLGRRHILPHPRLLLLRGRLVGHHICHIGHAVRRNDRR